MTPADQPLSILHLTTFLQGGAGRAIADLACAQLEAGHRVMVVTSATGEPGYGNYPHHLDRLTAAGVPVLLVDSLFKRDPALNRHALERVTAAVPDGSVDVVHAHAAVPARMALSYAERASRRPIVLQTQHGWGTSKNGEQARHDVAVLDEVDRVIVTSASTRAQLESLGASITRLTTLPCGIEPRLGGDDAETPVAARAAVAALRARRLKVVGCVGSVTPNKNQRVVLEALARLTTVKAGAVFVGEGGDGLAAAAGALGIDAQVVVAGYQPAAARWMPAFDLVVVPSLTEGQGLVVLEAFASGVPVAASDIAPFREVIAEGHTGWLFDPRDADALASAMTRALTMSAEERARVVQAARERAWRHDSVETVAAKHDALYRELIARRESDAARARHADQQETLVSR